MIDSDFLKKIGKEALFSLSTLLILTGVGTFLNFIFLFFLTPELNSLFHTSAGMGHASGLGAILALFLLLIYNWQASLLFVSFFLGFPFLHFLIVKKYVIMKALFHILQEKKSKMVEYILNQFFERIKNRLEWLDKLNSSGTISVLNEYLPIYIQKLEGMPFMIRWIVKLFLGRFDFLGIVSGVLNEQGQIDIGQKEIINKISDKVNTVLDEKLFSPSFTGIITLYIINISAFIIIKVIL